MMAQDPGNSSTLCVKSPDVYDSGSPAGVGIIWACVVLLSLYHADDMDAT